MKSKYTFSRILNAFALLVSKILILKVTNFYMAGIGCTLNFTREISRKVRRKIKIAMKFKWRNNYLVRRTCKKIEKICLICF